MYPILNNSQKHDRDFCDRIRNCDRIKNGATSECFISSGFGRLRDSNRSRSKTLENERLRMNTTLGNGYKVGTFWEVYIFALNLVGRPTRIEIKLIIAFKLTLIWIKFIWKIANLTKDIHTKYHQLCTHVSFHKNSFCKS